MIRVVMHKVNKAHKKPTIDLFSYFFILLMAFCSISCQRNEDKTVLVVHSFSEKNNWISVLNEEIRNGFRDRGFSVHLDFLYLEDDIVEIEEEASILNAFFNENNKKPDLILSCDDEALLSLLATKHPYVSEIPIVFLGVDYVPLDLLENHDNMTGFLTTPDYEKCYQLARRLFGQIDDIVLIAEDSPVGKVASTEARKQFEQFHNLTKIYESYLTFGKTDTLCSPRSVFNPLTLRIERVNMLPGSKLKNVLFYRLNSFCVLPQWRPFYSLLPRMGTAPFLMVNNEGFGDGQLGGYMTSEHDQAYDAVSIIIEILNGANPANIPITQSKQLPFFDWEQLRFWNIDLNRLPEDSVILNIPFYHKYKSQIIVSSIIIFLFITLFVLMMIRLYRREFYNKNLVREKLRKEQKELDITIDSLKEGVVSIDMDGIILSINRAAIQLLGLEELQSYVGHSVWNLFDIQERDNPFLLKDKIKELSHSLGSYKLRDKAFVVTKNKKIFSISGNISSLYHDGRSYGSVVTFHDTTDEYTQKEYLALSMIAGDIFAWRYDQATNCFYFDESFFHSFNILDNETHSITVDLFRDSIHPEDKEIWDNAIDYIFSETIKKITIQFRIKLSGCEYQWWEFRLASMQQAALGNIRYNLIGICMSVDNFKKAEQELIRLRDEAEQSDYQKSIFLANMSHEVRTPLNAIVGFSSLLINDSELTPQLREEFMSIINENCRLLLNLINEILDISRIESGITFRKEKCDLTEIMDALVHQFKEKKKENVELILDVPVKAIEILNDSYRIRQILSNLLENAFKFTEKGLISLGYSMSENSEDVILFVKDTGGGISEEALPAIYDRFYKSDEFVQGGGLGLSIVDEIVKRMNGRIEVESKMGKGTSFYVHLPIGEIDPLNKKEETHEV